MATYSTPGVYVNERRLTSLTNNVPGLSAAAFFGEAERGPTTPTLVNDWTSYKSLYGELSNEYDLAYAVFHYFSNGGRSCYVTRVTDATATKASYDEHPYYPNGTGEASAALFDVDAESAGTWGNNLTVQTLTGTVDPTSSTHGTFTLVVSLSGVEVERWPDLSIDPNANRYVSSIVNNYSRYIRVSNVSTTAASAGEAYFTTAIALTGGTQSTVSDSDYVSAFDQLDGINGNLIINAVGKTSTTVVTAAVAKATNRSDSFVIIDPNASDNTFSEIQATAANFASLAGGGYAAHYAPMLKMSDPGRTGAGAIRDTYPGGAVAGVMVRTEVERTVAKAPAGTDAEVRGALGLVVPITDAQLGALYNGTPQVNSFKAIRGAGVNIYGARTLSKTDPDKFIPVRRTLNYLKFSLKELTEFAVFEPNDANLWSQINGSVSGFLSDFWRNGGLAGDRASDAFYVLCDATNNPQTAIDQGIVNVEVGVALSYPAEFIVINLSQWSGGSNAIDSL